MPAFSFFNNQGLFADHFLRDRLVDLEEWKNPAGLESAFQQIKRVYHQCSSYFTQQTNEAQTEHDFIQPVLDILWGKDCYQVQVTIPNLDVRHQPDYAFFPSANHRQEAEPHKGTIEYWHDASCLGDAKKWSTSLDKERGAEENPTAQICNYLYRSRVRWGILTNGRIWRLYEREKSSAGGIFYQVNLERILQEGDLESFKYFYLFFRREAFSSGPEGHYLLAEVFQGSLDYATQVGGRLKESVYDALRLLMNGFSQHPANGLDASNSDIIGMVHQNCLILLYRLLFILYAEDKGLLPLEDPVYHDHSLKRLQGEINPNLRIGRTYLPAEHRFWGELKGLFELIDNGLIHNEKTIIPAYNGGLFSPSKFPHISHTPQPGVAGWEINDHRLSEVIDMLSYQRERWNQPGTQDIDYNSLEVQHLGSIYEGLLELQPHIATESLVETVEDAKSVFKPESEVPHPRPIRGQPPRMVKFGEVYLVTNRGDRKATGSYYTPKYIVDYIVHHTVGPLTDQASKQVIQIDPEVKKEINKLERTRSQWEGEIDKGNKAEAERHISDLNQCIERQKRLLLEPYLSLKILDPAMGSGHFLVGAADFLSLAMATDPYLLPLEEMGEEDPQSYYKRLVAERCLYGVDLNPLAVELAKLSLWLHTVSKDKALSFLDHYLRCGNSLIGAGVEEDLMKELPQFKVGARRVKAESKQLVLGFTQALTSTHLQYFLNSFREIMEAPSGKAEAERKKDALYRDMDAVRDKFRSVANCWLAPYFGAPVTPEQYEQAVNSLRGTEAEWQKCEQNPWFKKAQTVAKDKHFFHWELEFPEVFFNPHGLKPKEERGFDAVIGNPPYDVISEKEQQYEVSFDKSYFMASAVLRAAIGSKLNLYRLFIVLAINILKTGSQNSFIVPMAIMGDSQAKKLREELVKHQCLRLIEAFPQKDNPKDRAFFEAKLSTCLYVLEKRRPNPYHKFVVRIHTGKEILRSSSSILIKASDLEQFDPDNLSIPCYPNMTTAGFLLALKLVSVCKGLTLSEYATSQQGEVNLTTHARFLSDKPVGPMVLRGANIGRYTSIEEAKQGEPKYLHVKKFLNAHGPHSKAFDHRYVRIGYQRGAAIDNWRRIIGTVIEAHNFCSDTINYIINPKGFDLFSILALLNSSLWEWRFRLTSTNNHVNAYEIDGLPFLRISFTTPPEERTYLVEEGKRMYQDYLSTGSSDDLSEFVSDNLAQSPERSDVVHDLLAFLAQQMMEMNQQKGAEVKGFLTYLERYIGASVDDLSNRTKIKAYSQGTFQILLDILR